MAEVRALRKELHSEKWAWRSLRQRQQPCPEGKRQPSDVQVPPAPPPSPTNSAPKSQLSAPATPASRKRTQSSVVGTPPLAPTIREPAAKKSPLPQEKPDGACLASAGCELPSVQGPNPLPVDRHSGLAALVAVTELAGGSADPGPQIATCALPPTHVWDERLGRSRKKLGVLSVDAPVYTPIKRPRSPLASGTERPPPPLRSLGDPEGDDDEGSGPNEEH